MFLNTRGKSVVDVDTWKINIPFTLFSFVPPWVMTDWTQFENWRGAKAATLSGSLSLSSQRKFTRTGDLFIKTVSLKGDLPPVLDIERLPENQSVDRLKIGLKDG
jgi:lysozyme